MLDGSFVSKSFEPSALTILPGLASWLVSIPGSMQLLSMGNFWLEIVLPIAVLFVRGSARRVQIVEGLFLSLCFVSHIFVFFFSGHNFIRMMLLVLLAAEPLLHSGAPQRRLCATAAVVRSADFARGCVCQLLIVAWFIVQFRACLVHIFNIYQWNETSDPYWPIPELSMFLYNLGSSADVKTVAIEDVPGSTPILFRNIGTLIFSASLLLAYLWASSTHKGSAPSLTSIISFRTALTILKILGLPLSNAAIKVSVKVLFGSQFKFPCFITMCHCFATCTVVGIALCLDRNRKEKLSVLSAKVMCWATVLGLCQAFTVFFGNWALRFAGIAFVTMVSTTTPLFTYIGEKLVFPIPRPWVHTLGCAAVCIGACSCVFGEFNGEPVAGLGIATLAAVGLCAAANSLRASKTLIQQKMTQGFKIDTGLLLGCTGLTGGFMMLIVSSFIDGRKPLQMLASASDFALLGQLLGSCATAAFMNACQFFVIAEFGAVVGQVISSLNVVMPIVAGAILFQEHIDTAQIIGVVTMLIGIFACLTKRATIDKAASDLIKNNVCGQYMAKWVHGTRDSINKKVDGTTDS